MVDSEREQRRKDFLAALTADGRTRAEGIAYAAELLYVSRHTVAAWLKPETTKSSAKIPLWAVELFDFKVKASKKTLPCSS